MSVALTRWDEIEAEHAAILDALMRLRVQAAASKFSASALLPACLDLVRRFEEHFFHEEELMAETGFPDADAHHRHHQVLLIRLLSICARMTQQDTVEIAQLQLTFQSLLDDAIGVDGSFREFIEQA